MVIISLGITNSAHTHTHTHTQNCSFAVQFVMTVIGNGSRFQNCINHLVLVVPFLCTMA
jgi:hypothetical protein